MKYIPGWKNVSYRKRNYTVSPVIMHSLLSVIRNTQMYT